LGITVDIISGWTGRIDPNVYMTYDRNTGSISDHIRLNYLPDACLHFQSQEVGLPRYIKL